MDTDYEKFLKIDGENDMTDPQRKMIDDSSIKEVIIILEAEGPWLGPA